MFMKALYANVLLHRFAKFYGFENQIRKKGNSDSFPFSLYAVSAVEIRKAIALRLEVKMIINALYANVPNLSKDNDVKSTHFE